ncbi:tetratricopeptide repeat protein [Mucilaginibacter celer]|uniref:Tetratricopeptide repeat protein n=1 Tax=Mucilaginibacter celer TaxID=2305508 RepID=A0A494VP78_9SPHI|nr:tetratricopeptide repeat protein [Mucilaginibacter celer]AYL95621.1 hypothetical protein HYN43_010100 [Mucilaginibacter celer]
MKKILIPVLFLVTYCNRVSAQAVQKEIDSLTLQLQKHTGQDTARVMLLNDLAYAYYVVNPDKGLEQAKAAAALASRLSYTRGLATAFSRMSVNYWAKGQDSLAMQTSEKAIRYYKLSGNLLGYAKALNNRALNHYALENYIAAIHDHEEALAIFKKLNFPLGIQNSYNNTGVVFLALNDYPRALDNFLKASRVLPGAVTSAQANILANIGLVYKNMKTYPKAFSYQQQALKIYQSVGDQQGIANSLGNIATVYDLSHKDRQALVYYQQALTINRTIGNKAHIASDLTNIGVLYHDARDFSRAEQYLKEAVALYSETTDKNDLSEALLALAANEEKRPGTRDRAGLVERLQKASLQAAEAGGSPLRKSEALEALSNTYEKAGRFQLALDAYKKHILLQDTIFNKAKDQEILRKQLEFDFEQKELVTKAEIQRQKMVRQAVVAGSAVLLVMLGSGFLLYKRKQDAVNRKKAAEYKATVAETELKVLRSQMNPHFIFNSLNAINDYIAKNDKETAQQYLVEFAGLMRQALENSHFSEIPLADDLDFIRQYLQVEARRLKNTFAFEINIDPEIDTENTLIPPLLLQPFIENSIWHGMAPKVGTADGLITISLKKKDDLLICTIEDNGVGKVTDARQQTAKRRSFGLELTESRLAILNEKKQAGGQLQISENLNGKGTKVELSLPLKMAF